MDNFDFVSGDDFRSSLEADYQELSAAVEACAWKAAHVLAGSIVEAILIDYLVAIKHEGKAEEAILKMSLDQAIVACQKGGLLSERAANLSTVVRGYRNLIHPGRIVRLRETVDENGARVAQSLVNMIITEVASRKKQSFGYTAEQITTKIQQDEWVRPILPHLLKETRDHELERLLLVVLPSRYYELTLDPEVNSKVLANMRICFRQAFDQVDDTTKAKVAKRFVSIVKEEGGEYVNAYEAAFFQGSDLGYLSASEQSIAKRHLISRLAAETQLSFETILRTLRGLGPFLTKQEARLLANAVIREMKIYADEDIQWRFIRAMDTEYSSMSAEVQADLINLLDLRIRTYRKSRAEDSAARIQQLKDYLEKATADDIPF